MKCRKCGAILATGHLYCDVCGAEYQIVPDFEPELEISMAQTLWGVSEVLQKDTQSMSVPTSQEKDSGSKKFRPMFKGIMFLLLICFFAVLGIRLYKSSVGYLEKRAKEAETQGDYAKAAECYEQLKLKQPEEGKWYLHQAQIYLRQGEMNEALVLGLQALETGEESEEAYRFLLELYLQQKEYQKLTELLVLCPKTIQQEYAQYLAPQPEADYSSGRYDSNLEVTLLAPSVEPESGVYEKAELIQVEVEEGTRVYYTTDGTIPNRESRLYQEAIPMPLGESHFAFVAYRGEELSGEITRRDYLLNIKTGITQEEAGDLLVQEMIQKGRILDSNGALAGYYGVHRYFYTYPLLIEEQHYYVFTEHYLENEINRQTGRLYAVDVIQGACYQLTKEDSGKYSLEEI